MKTICAWCTKLIKSDADANTRDMKVDKFQRGIFVSHGICLDCLWDNFGTLGDHDCKSGFTIGQGKLRKVHICYDDF